MMKKLTFLLAVLLSFGALSSCSKAVNSGFVGTYWLEAYTVKTVQDGFYEKIEYKVSSIEFEEGYAPRLNDVNNNQLNFSIDEEKSSYVTELYGENGLYVYKTKLEVYGWYEVNDVVVYEVVGDVTETETTFKGREDDFACVKSIKKIKNVYPIEQVPSTSEDFVTITADFTIEYQDKKANLKVDAKDEVSKQYLATVSEPITVNKYNKKAYIDNELMLLLLRNFKYETTLSYTFKTIESSTGTLKEISASPRLITENVSSDVTKQTAIKTIDTNCYIDSLGGRLKRKINTFGITFKTTGEYSQNFAYAYYANSIGDDVDDAENKSRHFLVQCYRPMIYNIGYMVFTLDSVTHVKG